MQIKLQSDKWASTVSSLEPIGWTKIAALASRPDALRAEGRPLPHSSRRSALLSLVGATMRPRWSIELRVGRRLNAFGVSNENSIAMTVRFGRSPIATAHLRCAIIWAEIWAPNEGEHPQSRLWLNLPANSNL